MIDPDRLLYNFRVTAGIPTNGTMPYGGWESPTSLVRGEFISMYMTALVQGYVNTGDTKMRDTVLYMVDVMAQCQRSDGYLAAYPSTFFDLLEDLQFDKINAPYYMIEKNIRALLNVHLMIGHPNAFDMLLRMADYFLQRIRNVIKVYTFYRWWLILTVEFGGMNEIMYDVYAITNNPEHLELAQFFDRGDFLGPLAINKDPLTAQHANVHIPIVLGAARRHEVVEDSDEFKKVVENFWNILYTTRTYATGGSNGGNGSDYATLEHWGEPNRLLLTLTNNNQEFCTQYAILKVIKYLIEWTGDIKYADHFEQAYFNGIMGNQYPGQPGVML